MLLSYVDERERDVVVCFLLLIVVHVRIVDRYASRKKQKEIMNNSRTMNRMNKDSCFS